MNDRKHTEIFNALMLLLGIDSPTLQQVLDENYTAKQFSDFTREYRGDIVALPQEAADNIARGYGVLQLRYAILLWSGFEKIAGLCWNLFSPKYIGDVRSIVETLSLLEALRKVTVTGEREMMWDEGVLLECTLTALTETSGVTETQLWFDIMQFCIRIVLVREYMICTNSPNAEMLDEVQGACVSVLSVAGVALPQPFNNDFIAFMRAIAIANQEKVNSQRMCNSILHGMYKVHPTHINFVGPGFSAEENAAVKAPEGANQALH